MGGSGKKYFKYEMPINEKKDLNLNEKKTFAKIARRFIREGGVIFIGGGATTYELAKLLNDISNIKVVMNSLNILLELSNNKSIKIKIPGGDFRQETLSFVGSDATNILQKYIFNKTFIGANGVSINEG